MSTLATADKSGALPEAWMYRADHLSSKVFHIRFGVLNGHILEVYKGDHMLLEHAFPLTDAKVSSVNAEECDIKPQGVNMLKGYFDGSIEPKMLHIFKIKVSRTQSMLHNKLILGFDAWEDAQSWRDKICTAIHPGLGTCPTSDERSSSRQVHVPDGPFPTEPSMRSVDDISHHGTQPRRRSTAASSHLPTQRPSPMPKTAPLNASTAWEPKFNTNGLAGYREPVEGTYATCFSIAATPTQVFQHLVVLPDGSTAWSFFEDVKVLAAPDSDDGATVFHARLGTRSGWLPWLGRWLGVAPRDAVLLQTWLMRDYDGVLSLSFHSVEHDAAPAAARRSWADVFTRWFQPVRAEIHRLAFTVAPLAQHLWDSDGRLPEEAPECMVTMLVRADLGGVLDPSPAMPSAGMLWIAPLIKSLIQVRDSLHQQRFVEPLFRVFGEHANPGALAASNAEARAASLRRANFSFRVPSLADPLVEAIASVPAAGNVTAAAAAAADAVEADTAAEPEPAGWLPNKFFYSPDGCEFKVRGRNYLSDKRKQPSAEPAFRLKAMEAITTDAPVPHISPFLPVVAHSRAAFLLPVHFTLPYAGRLMHLVIVFEADADPTAEEGAAADGPFTRALAEFLTGTSPADDRRRNNTLKLIPMVKDGSWVMRQAVGTTPVIIGNKLRTTYHRGERHLEVTIDISSNSTAAGITNYVAGSVSSLAIWLGFVLEGKRSEHLPERLLGTVCLDHLDLKAATHVDVSEPLPSKPTRAVATADTDPITTHKAQPTEARQAAAEAAAAGEAAGGGTPPIKADGNRAAMSGSSSAASAKTSTSFEMVEPPLKRPQ